MFVQLKQNKNTTFDRLLCYISGHLFLILQYDVWGLKTLFCKHVLSLKHSLWLYFYKHVINHIECVPFLLQQFAACPCHAECKRRTSDISMAASSLHQIQPDSLIDARLMERVYASDRILEWTFPSSVRHRQGPLPLVFSVERHGER